MSSSPRVSATAANRVRDVALIACTVWLLVQNSVLAVWLSSQHLTPLFVVARALLKVGLHLAGQLWMLPVVALLGVALALSTGERHDAGPKRKEVSHA
jgi:hypothetical protein